MMVAKNPSNLVEILTNPSPAENQNIAEWFVWLNFRAGPVCPPQVAKTVRFLMKYYTNFISTATPFCNFWLFGPSFSFILAFWAVISFLFGILGLDFLWFWPFWPFGPSFPFIFDVWPSFPYILAFWEVPGRDLPPTRMKNQFLRKQLKRKLFVENSVFGFDVLGFSVNSCAFIVAVWAFPFGLLALFCLLVLHVNSLGFWAGTFRPFMAVQKLPGWKAHSWVGRLNKQISCKVALWAFICLVLAYRGVVFWWPAPSLALSDCCFSLRSCKVACTVSCKHLQNRAFVLRLVVLPRCDLSGKNDRQNLEETFVNYLSVKRAYTLFTVHGVAA